MSSKTLSSCISCGKKLILLGRNRERKIFKCSNCGLGITDDVKFVEQYQAYHRDHVYYNEEKQFANIFRKRINIISHFATHGKALEIGSSTGLFLSLLKKKGWEVLGIEPSKISSQIASDSNIPTLVTTFELSRLPPNSFDLVILSHVLEHMEDPVAVLKKINKVLRKDGVIFIDVPNFGGIVAQIKGPVWEYILPDEHKWHFTEVALNGLLAKTGFVIVQSSTHSGIWGYGSPLEELWQSLINLRKRFIWNLISSLPSLVVTLLDKGSGLTVVARKK